MEVFIVELVTKSRGNIRRIDSVHVTRASAEKRIATMYVQPDELAQIETRMSWPVVDFAPVEDVRQTACERCGLDIEAILKPSTETNWRDRGNNRHCPHGGLHTPAKGGR